MERGCKYASMTHTCTHACDTRPRWVISTANTHTILTIDISPVRKSSFRRLLCSDKILHAYCDAKTPSWVAQWQLAWLMESCSPMHCLWISYRELNGNKTIFIYNKYFIKDNFVIFWPENTHTSKCNKLSNDNVRWGNDTCVARLMHP